jgi:hypothetical protein
MAKNLSKKLSITFCISTEFLESSFFHMQGNSDTDQKGTKVGKRISFVFFQQMFILTIYLCFFKRI